MNDELRPLFPEAVRAIAGRRRHHRVREARHLFYAVEAAPALVEVSWSRR